MLMGRIGEGKRLAKLAIVLGAAVAATMVPAPGPVSAGHSFTMSDGVYRIPYANGTNVTVTGDHHDHNPPDRFDLAGAAAGQPIVAAAPGIIRAVVDIHGNSPGPGNGVANDGSPQNDALEHSCQDGTPAVPDSVVQGLCQDYNNYVWIEHPNGEWTKYSHFGTGTVTANGWVVGMAVDAGDVLGLEGDVGRASGRHLHSEVAIPSDPNDPTPFTTLGGFIQGVNVVPYVCDIPGNLYSTGSALVANDCVSIPAPALCSVTPVPGAGAIIAVPGVVTVGTPGDDVIYGTPGPDRIAGLGGNDVIFGGGGDDQISGGDGDDTICGGVGDDEIAGGPGDDVISGGAGDDDLAEGPGDGQLFGWFGADRLAGGAGTDTCTTGGDPGDATAGCE